MDSIGGLSPTIANDWLDTQCRMIPGVVTAAVFDLESGPEPLPIARWPLDSEFDLAGHGVHLQSKTLQIWLRYSSDDMDYFLKSTSRLICDGLIQMQSHVQRELHLAISPRLLS